MRFMLLQNYGEVESHCLPMTEWTPGDIKAHIEFQYALNRELTERGELVDAQGLCAVRSPTTPRWRACWP